MDKKISQASSRLSSESALESETEDDDVRVTPPTMRKSKDHGNGYAPPTEDLGPRGGNAAAEGGFVEERGYGVPILASDEVARTPITEYQQPAVSPAQERRGSSYYSSVDSDGLPSYQSGFRSGSRPGSASNSRPTSRPASVHSVSGPSRFSTYDEDWENVHTPLEDVDEYEPLFPDEDGDQERRPVTAAERLKLREQMKRFPSKDIWEDAPNSLQLQATVETPEPANKQTDPILKATTAVFETPDQESARKGEASEDEKAKLIPREERLAKSHFKPHLREEMNRPSLGQRFPSRDIWEDSPESSRLETTVGGPQSSDPKSLPDEGLEAGAVVTTSGRPDEGIISGEQPRDEATAGAPIMKPSIPPRPIKSKVSPTSPDLGVQPTPSLPSRPPRRVHQVPPANTQVPIAPSKASETSAEEKQPSSTEARKAPLLPERSKPQVPTRPIKPMGRESSETIPLSKVTSTSSAGSDGATERDQGGMKLPPAPKPKPAVPARPAGGKIASLKAGFLSDLDSRLKLGPQGPKPQEKLEPELEEEKAPLTDARKGRAKGPARRKPAAPSTANITGLGVVGESLEGKGTVRSWHIQEPWTVWQTDDNGFLKVVHSMPSALKAEAMTLGGMSKAAQAIPSASEAGNTEDANDMRPANLAVAESLTSTEPLSQEEVDGAAVAMDLPTPTREQTRNPLSKEASNLSEREAQSAPSTLVSPTNTNAKSQIGEKNRTVNPGTETEEKMTAYLEGEAQREGGDFVSREE